MIHAPRHKVDKSDEFKRYVKLNPDLILLTECTILPENSLWEGYVKDIPYGTTVLTKHNKKTFTFKQKTDGTFEVF